MMVALEERGLGEGVGRSRPVQHGAPPLGGDADQLQPASADHHQAKRWVPSPEQSTQMTFITKRAP
jgi:hypothetical protein